MSSLREAFRDQAQACRGLGSPFMDRLCTLLSTDWPENTRLTRKCAGFAGDPGPAGHSLPLRIAGGLHALRLRSEPGLAAIYPPNTPDEPAFRAAILDALHRHETFVADWIDSPPQTNEIRRSAVLIPAARMAAARFGLPIRLSELGASGGLNLMWDRFALQGPDWRVGPADPMATLAPEWDGPPPEDVDPVIAERRGVDLMPLDPTDPDDLLRLTAFLWADQPHRLAMTRAAAGAVTAPVDRSDAIDWLEQRLADAPHGQLHVIQNIIAWQYFPPERQARGRRLIETAGAAATEARPMAWVQLENDGDPHGAGGAAITLQLWPGGGQLSLGRADFHGRWVRWLPEARGAAAS